MEVDSEGVADASDRQCDVDTVISVKADTSQTVLSDQQQVGARLCLAGAAVN